MTIRHISRGRFSVVVPQEYHAIRVTCLLVTVSPVHFRRQSPIDFLFLRLDLNRQESCLHRCRSTSRFLLHVTWPIHGLKQKTLNSRMSLMIFLGRQTYTGSLKCIFLALSVICLLKMLMWSWGNSLVETFHKGSVLERLGCSSSILL